MTDEQKYVIPLDSPLDINSNDMLVPASKPLFSFNRQRYLGTVLQNSVRYESDGWFAGWWVHHFTPVSLGSITITPQDIGLPSLQDKYIPGSLTEKYWIAKFPLVQLEFRYVDTLYSNWSSGSGTITRTGDTTVTISGVTTQGEAFTAVTDPYTGLVSSYTIPTDFEISGYLNNGLSILTVEKPVSPSDDVMNIRVGSPAIIDNTPFNYSYDGSKHMWGDFITNINNNITIDSSKGYNLQDYTLVNPGAADEHFDLNLQSHGAFTVTKTLAGILVGGYTKFTGFKKVNEYDKQWTDDYNMNEVTGMDSVNTEEPFVVDLYNPDRVQNSYVDAAWKFPIWMKLQMGFTISMEFNVIGEGGTERSRYKSGYLWLCIKRTAKTGRIQDRINYTDNKWILHSGNYDYDENQIPTTGDPYRIRVGNQVTLYYNPGSDDTPPVENPVTTTNTFTFRTVNTAADFPFPADYQYGEIRFAATCTWYYSQVGHQDSYTAVTSKLVGNGITLGEDLEDEPILNRKAIFAEDTHIFGDGGNPDIATATHNIKVIWPICTYGYMLFRVTCTDVTLNLGGATVAESFTTSVVTNATSGKKWFRLDSGGAANCSIGTMEAYVVGIAPASPTTPSPDSWIPFNLTIGYKNNSNIQFDKVVDYHWPEQAITDMAPLGDLQENIPKKYLLEYGFYPKWIIDSYGGENYWRKYSEFDGSQSTTHYAQVSLMYLPWISGAEGTTVAYSPESTPNLNFSQDIQNTTFDIVNLPGLNVPYAYGVFSEQASIQVDEVNKVTLTYNASSKATSFVWSPAPPLPWSAYGATLSRSGTTFTLKINLTRYSDSTTELYRAFFITKRGLLAGVNLLNVTGSIMTLNSPYGIVNSDSGNWYNHDASGLDEVAKETTEYTIQISAGKLNRANVEYLAPGIFAYNKKVTNVSMTGTTLRFIYDGTTYTLTRGTNVTARLVYSVTDIRDGTEREIAALDMSSIQMAIKQFWSNDVDTENFWWVDSSHVLVLTKYEVQLHEKQATHHDWNGNNWEIIKRGARGNFFNNLDLYYAVSSAYGTSGILFRLRNTGTSITCFMIADIVNADFLNPVWTSKVIPIIQLVVTTGGTTPSQTGISSYVPLNINELLCSSKISSTVVNGIFMLGFAVTRGLQQWVCKWAVPSGNVTVITGYGHVGHDGSLTGGQYPEFACGLTGFKGACYPLDMFKDYSSANPVDKPDNKIFISGASIWFVRDQWSRIVSHYIFSGTSHVAEYIPIACNYSFESQRSGHSGAAMYDTLPRPMGIIDLLTMSGDSGSAASTALSLFGAIAIPSLWYLQPILVSGVFCAQGMHQTAYVVRNSLPVKSEDGKSDKDNAVIRHIYDMSQSIDLSDVKSFVSLILGIVGSILSTASDDGLKVNASQDASAVSDTIGRKFSQFAATAAIDAVSTSLSTKGLVYSAKTKAREIMSLGMFYTINDGVECWAGPGFVNHNFIGQAMAQGVALARFKMDRYGAYFPLQFISQLLARGQMQVVQSASDAVHKIFDQPGGNAGGGFFVQIPVLWIAAAVAQLAIVAVDTILFFYKMMVDALPTLYETLGSEGRGFYAGGIERNVVEIEATHTYGNKPMSMFWPAFGFESAPINTMTVEAIQSKVAWDGIDISQSGYANCIPIKPSANSLNNISLNSAFFSGSKPFKNKLYLPRTYSFPTATKASLPARTALVEGVVNMLQPNSELKNLQVNCCDYTFPAPPIHDYVIAEAKKIGVQAANGEIISYSMDDTKLIDGPASNIIENGEFFGISSSYAVIEVKDTYDHDYLRPWAITPTCIALNLSGFNCVQMAQAYHGFEGQFNRITSWKGGNGLDSATLCQQYCIIVNDHFKRSNILPPSEFFGLFNGTPAIAMKTMGKDRIANQVMDMTRQKGMEINIPGEDRDLTRFAVPVHSEMLSTLPAVVRMLAPYKLHVVEGVTSLTTDVRSTQTKYKAPSSVDFNLYDTMYRATEEYIALLTMDSGVVQVEDKFPSSGLTFIGATTKEAFFYSPATRMYYSFSGDSVNKQDIFNRFKDIKNGRWDFVNQEVVFKMLLGDRILKDDVTGDFVARLDAGEVIGEMYPPNATIYNERSDYKILSMAGGLVYQGPKRCAINRWVLTDDMYNQIKVNKKRWKKLDREAWSPGRDYGWEYEDLSTEPPFTAVYGWTHNPWRAATAMLGVSEETDCLFEWELTFAWTEQVDRVFEQNEFMSFNLAGEMISQGGTLLSRPTHLFLHKGLFKNGYYSMRYTAKNGMGNRERLYMWGDGMAALESLTLYTKDMTTRRAQPLVTSQIDVQNLVEQ